MLLFLSGLDCCGAFSEGVKGLESLPSLAEGLSSSRAIAHSEASCAALLCSLVSSFQPGTPSLPCDDVLHCCERVLWSWAEELLTVPCCSACCAPNVSAAAGQCYFSALRPFMEISFELGSKETHL